MTQIEWRKVDNHEQIANVVNNWGCNVRLMLSVMPQRAFLVIVQGQDIIRDQQFYGSGDHEQMAKTYAQNWVNDNCSNPQPLAN